MHVRQCARGVRPAAAIWRHQRIWLRTRAWYLRHQRVRQHQDGLYKVERSTTGGHMMALHPVRLAGVMLIIALGCPAVATAQSSGWRSLFDGTTLTGWTSVGEARWTVVDRAMAANPS